MIRYNYYHDIVVPFNVRAVYHDDGSGFELVLPEGVPPTSKPEAVFRHEGFSGINRGVMDELHTTFQGTSTL